MLSFLAGILWAVLRKREAVAALMDRTTNLAGLNSIPALFAVKEAAENAKFIKIMLNAAE
ncbi:MAG: hypothetical protein ACM3S2_18040 [Ignavibacteriales bacterium]